jgi:hypothetical protein
VAVIAGGGIGFAVGEPVRRDDILPARTLPADVCSRLGDVSALLPQASSGPVTLEQRGKTTVTCEASLDPAKRITYSDADVHIAITPYAGKDAGAGQAPYRPAAAAKLAFDRSPLDSVEGRPYPTKVSRRSNGIGDESWSVKALVQHADVIVQVEYVAHPIEQKAAEQAAMAVADRAIWETR